MENTVDPHTAKMPARKFWRTRPEKLGLRFGVCVSCRLSTMRTALLVACVALALSACSSLREQPTPENVPELIELPQLIENANKGDAEAVERLRLAAEHGVGKARMLTGNLYRRGTPDVPRDGAEAVKWYRRCALEGESSCQFALATMYDAGVDVPQNYAEAAKWYRLLAEQGEMPEQIITSRMYLDGRGVPQDYVQAHMWANLAAANSQRDDEESKAAALRAAIEKLLTARQIVEAQRLATEWKPKTWNELKER